MTCALTAVDVQNAQQALLSALRREDTAAKQVHHLQSELAALQDLLTANQRELQRNQMVMKFRNAEVERRRVRPHQHLRDCPWKVTVIIRNPVTCWSGEVSSLN